MPGLLDPGNPPPTDPSRGRPTRSQPRGTGNGAVRPFEVLDRSFQLLVGEPAPLALDGVAVDGLPDRADAWLYVLLPRSSAVEVAAAASAVGLGLELAFQLGEAPDPGAIGAEVGLDVGGRRSDGGQVDAEQLCAPLQRRRDRPAQVRVVPGPHPISVSNTSSRVDQQRCVVRRGRSAPGWAALGPQLSGTWGTAKDSRGE